MTHEPGFTEREGEQIHDRLFNCSHVEIALFSFCQTGGFSADTWVQFARVQAAQTIAGLIFLSPNCMANHPPSTPPRIKILLSSPRRTMCIVLAECEDF